eukprot:1499746-Prymnesium_polylepis.1
MVGERRRRRIEDALGRELPRAVGAGWWALNPLGPRALSETEAMLELQGRAIHRCLLRPASASSCT